MISPTAVTFDPDHRLWLLTTPSTSYALRLDDDDTPRNVHWGPSLTLAEATSLPGSTAGIGSSFGHKDGAELPAEGGAQFGVPSLLVEYSDGARGVDWHYRGHTIDAGHLQVAWRDRHRPLEITLHYRLHPDSDVIERWMDLRNCGDAPITLLRSDSAAWTLPHRAGYRISHVSGDWAAETQLQRTPLPAGELTFTSRRGVTSHHANPWVMLDDTTATETGGEVWSAALAWSGSWRVTVHREAGGARFTGGFGHEGLTWRLLPAEHWSTPVFAGLYSQDGFGGASRRWHQYITRHVLPNPDELRPIMYNSWEATGFAVNANNQRHLAHLAAQIGTELFVMDDGWFSTRTDDTSGLGDWTINPDRFPNGLKPLIAEVHRLGMRFGIWVEPEMVNPDSDLYRRHPDWVLHMPERHRTELRNQLVLNFARSDVAQWAHTWLDRLVSTHDIDFLKWDMNRAFTEAGWPGHDNPDRLWIDHARNVYSIIDRLRSDHPQLRIEACAGGGGRADLGMLARTDQIWASDNTDPVDRLTIHHGFSQLYPAHVMAAWVTDSPNPFTGRDTPLRFRFHVAMTGVLGIGGNLLEWPEAELSEAAELTEQYKAVRPIIQHGSLFRLDDAVQYLAADGSEAVVIAWYVHRPVQGWPSALRLSGLDPHACYLDTRTGRMWQGAVLLSHGIDIDLPTCDYASALIHLHRIE